MALDNKLSGSTLSEFESKSLQEKQQQLLVWISNPTQLTMPRSDTYALALPAYTDDNPTLELLAQALVAVKYPNLQTLQNLILQGIAGGEELLGLFSYLLDKYCDSRGLKVSDSEFLPSYFKRRRDEFERLIIGHNTEELRNFNLFHQNDYLFLPENDQSNLQTRQFFHDLVKIYSELGSDGIIGNAISLYTTYLDENEKVGDVNISLAVDVMRARTTAYYVAMFAKNLSNEYTKIGVINAIFKRYLIGEKHPLIVNSIAILAGSLETDKAMLDCITELFQPLLKTSEKYEPTQGYSVIGIPKNKNVRNASTPEMQGALRRGIAIAASKLKDENVKKNYIKPVFPSLEEMKVSEDYSLECLNCAYDEILKFAESMKSDDAKLLFVEQALIELKNCKFASPYANKLLRIISEIEIMLSDESKSLLETMLKKDIGARYYDAYSEIRIQPTDNINSSVYYTSDSEQRIPASSIEPMIMARRAKDALTSMDQSFGSNIIYQFWDHLNNHNPLPIHDKMKQIYLAIEQVHNYRKQRSSNKREYRSVFTRYSLFGFSRWALGASSRTQKLAAADWLLNHLNNPEIEALDPKLQKALTSDELGKVYSSCRSAGLC